MFNEGILCAWKANLDIQIVLEPYGCASCIVGYISKSQRGMSAQLDAAAKEARKGNLDLKKQVRHIGNVFSNCIEVSAQEAVYLDLQIPLTKCPRDIVFVNTSVPEERLFLLKPKAVLDELPAESTDRRLNAIMFYLHFLNFLSVIYRWNRNEVFYLLSNSDVAYIECLSTYKAFNFAASPKIEC